MASELVAEHKQWFENPGAEKITWEKRIKKISKRITARMEGNLSGFILEEVLEVYLELRGGDGALIHSDKMQITFRQAAFISHVKYEN